jgi:hypothetical protein
MWIWMKMMSMTNGSCNGTNDNNKNNNKNRWTGLDDRNCDERWDDGIDDAASGNSSLTAL